MKILIVTSEWPDFPGSIEGIHVVNQISRLEQAGLLVDVLHFHGRKNPLNYLRAIRELKKKDMSQYDVIHAHHGQAGIVALSQNLRPVVVTFHGSDLQGIRDLRGRVTPLGYVLRFSSWWVASCANEIILVSQHLARYLPTGRAFQVIPAGIDLDLFRPIPIDEARRTLGLPLDRRLVLFVGNPARTEKRLWLAESAVASLREDPAFVVELIVANNVPHDQISLYMNACDVLVLTSSTEGSPNVVKEALACNLSIVSTDVGDVRQRIENIEGCLVCSDDNPISIAKALKQILSLPRRIKGRDRVLDLEEKNLINKVITVYQKLLQ